MSAGSISPSHPNDCGCCAGLAAETPAVVVNRPGLSAVSYRAGTHSSFKASMLAALSSAEFPALKELRTRADDDFTIALLDAAAVVADVLTFYQERLVNESFLRTATERRSVLELARLIGYELHPGVAASAALAFTLEEAPGAPRETVIDVGTRVQSIPGPGEKPQTFETIEKITARVEWNALRPKMTRINVPKFGNRVAYLKGIATNLKPGDAILLVGKERENDPGSERWDFRRLTEVSADAEANRTRIEWSRRLGRPPRRIRCCRQWSRKFSRCDNAPRCSVPMRRIRRRSLTQTLGHYNQQPGSDWNFTISGQTIDLDTTYPAIVERSWLVLSKPSYQELYRASKVTEASGAKFTVTGKTTRIQLDTNENLSLIRRRGLPRHDGVRAKRVSRDGRRADRRCRSAERWSNWRKMPALSFQDSSLRRRARTAPREK